VGCRKRFCPLRQRTLQCFELRNRANTGLLWLASAMPATLDVVVRDRVLSLLDLKNRQRKAQFQFVLEINLDVM
jgi:hypothetical protein